MGWCGVQVVVVLKKGTTTTTNGPFARSIPAMDGYGVQVVVGPKKGTTTATGDPIQICLFCIEIQQKPSMPAQAPPNPDFLHFLIKNVIETEHPQASLHPIQISLFLN